MKSLFSFMIVCLLAIPASAQLFCDINGDSLFTAADIIYLVGMLNMPPEDFYACGVNCDLDDDGESLTIADMALTFYLIYPSREPPYLTYNPSGDTMIVESTEASPGDLISLPIWFSSIDSLIAYELLIKLDPQYLAIESFAPEENMEFQYSASSNLLHIYNMAAEFIMDSVFIPPGSYHLGDLSVSVDADIEEPVTTYIEFVSCPEENFYTGMANMTFFVPVLVNGEITITPTGIDDEHPNLPSATSIEVYPNPFNSSVNLRVQSNKADRLIIYDVLGREIAGFQVKAGLNILTWDTKDSEGVSVNTGIYFARLQNNLNGDSKKLLLIR